LCQFNWSISVVEADSRPAFMAVQNKLLCKWSIKWIEECSTVWDIKCISKWISQTSTFEKTATWPLSSSWLVGESEDDYLCRRVGMSTWPATHADHRGTCNMRVAIGRNYAMHAMRPNIFQSPLTAAVQNPSSHTTLFRYPTSDEVRWANLQGWLAGIGWRLTNATSRQSSVGDTAPTTTTVTNWRQLSRTSCGARAVTCDDTSRKRETATRWRRLANKKATEKTRTARSWR